ncbi:MAG: DUF4915 domain-containing protein [Acidobacteriota bacterium]
MTARRRAPRGAPGSRAELAWRDPAQVASLWKQAASTDPRLLHHTVRGDWWETLSRLGIVLIVSREYEHLLFAIAAPPEGPSITYWPLPHPSGIALDVKRNILYVASTRSPNQLYEFAPAAGLIARRDRHIRPIDGRPLLPARARFLPGCLYLHDLAMIGTILHGCSVGQNAIVRLRDAEPVRPVWWPRCVEVRRRPELRRNHIQLNSIAAGRNLRASYFTASSDRISTRRPGHPNYPVDRRGVLFSGATREPVAFGLTRPHSARFHAGQVWLDDSGYGDVGFVEEGRFQAVARMPGWTRGLAFHGEVAFVGTSRVLPRFRRYAPGLERSSSVCGVHAVDTRSGRILGSLLWPGGNQIFAVEPVSRRFTTGFPFRVGRAASATKIRDLFYAFSWETDR